MSRNAMFHAILVFLDGGAYLEAILLGTSLGSVRAAVRRHGSCGSENGQVAGRVGSTP